MFSHIIIVALFFSNALAQLDPRWKLVWNDEFNSSTLDPAKWKVINVQGLSGNGEKEYYLPEQVYVENGNLVLKSDNISYVSAYPYRSGEVNSLWAGTFGRYEVRAKLPGGKGMWPAHWLLSQDLCWPVGSELDIMEAIGDNHNIYGTVHFSEKCYTGIANGTVYKAPFDYTQDYHVYAIEWNATSISWFVDDVEYNTVYDSSVWKGQPFALDTSPHYWILNTAVGGSWPGVPDSSTVFPQYHVIDYVRVYGWEPCVTGCGNGCCYEPLEICICDENYQGTNCEYIAKGKTPGAAANCTQPPPPPPTPTPTPPPTPPPCNVPSVPSFKRDFSTPFNSSLDSFGNGTQGPTWEQPSNAQIVNGQLQLTATNKGCPEACFGSQFTGASYSTAQSFGSGTFTFNLKASDILGTGVLFWLTGWSGTTGWNAYQFGIAANDASKVSCQMWWGSYENENAGEYDLGFDSSEDFHTYTFEYHPAQISSFYADGNLIFTVAPGPDTPMALKAEFFINPDYYGKFNDTAPANIYVADLAWQTNCGSSSKPKGSKQMSFSV